MTLSQEFVTVRRQLRDSYNKQLWSEFSSSLNLLATRSEAQGHLELASRARSLRELMGERGCGCEQSGKKVTQLFEDLDSHLCELQWQWSVNSAVSH